MLALALAACAKQPEPLTFRGLVTSLDSAVLGDTATIRPMNPDDGLDSVMLGMGNFLDREVGPAFGITNTRIRHWDGYGTQAHPTLGILVDSAEVAGLLDTVIRYKGQANVAAEEISRRLPHVARFLIAHEYAHLLQYRSLDHDSVADLNATRTIECGADLLGGFFYLDYLTFRYGDELPEAATQTAIDFGYVVGAKDWLDGTTHPLPEGRRECIGRGVDAAKGVRAMRAGSQDSAQQASVRWLDQNEPELYRKAADLVAWSRMRSRAIVSKQSVVDSSAVFAVVRDTSAEQLVRKLAAATAEGSVALRRFRGPPGPTGEYLLREALPPPWECVIGEVDSVETARCTLVERMAGSSSEFLYLVQAVENGLEGTRWRRVNDDDEVAFRGPVVFTEKGRDPHNPGSARIEVASDITPESATAQLPPDVETSLYFRAKR
jgi:hypothetical protein